MREFTKRINSMMFDVAAATILLVLIGVPLIGIAAVIILIVITVKLVKKARKKNLEEEKNPENNDSSGEAE